MLTYPFMKETRDFIWNTMNQLSTSLFHIASCNKILRYCTEKCSLGTFFAVFGLKEKKYWFWMWYFKVFENVSISILIIYWVSNNIGKKLEIQYERYAERNLIIWKLHWSMKQLWLEIMWKFHKQITVWHGMQY